MKAPLVMAHSKADEKAKSERSSLEKDAKIQALEHQKESVVAVLLDDRIVGGFLLFSSSPPLFVVGRGSAAELGLGLKNSFVNIQAITVS